MIEEFQSWKNTNNVGLNKEMPMKIKKAPALRTGAFELLPK